MKQLPFIVLCLLTILNAQCVSAQEMKLQPVSDFEAARIVQAQEEARVQRKAEIRAKIESATVAHEFVHQNGHRQIILRRVHGPAFSVGQKESNLAQSHSTEAVREFSLMSTADYRFEMISISANNYDDLYAEITWREQGASDTYKIWTNVTLKYLSMLSSFEFGDVHYDCFGFIHEINKELEQERTENWEFNGHAYESKWKVPPVDLSTTEPEYVVIADDPLSVPDKLFEQMDAVISYYLENKGELQIAHENLVKLNQAHAAYREANPPDPSEESVTIFWPIKNSRYLNDTK